MKIPYIENQLSQLKKDLRSHAGMCELERFGNNLKKRPLHMEELKIFMATLWAFYKETPSGILSLALQVSDHWKEINPWEANAMAAHLLYASVDEFGLHAAREAIHPTHHQLFKNTAHYFGVSTEDLCSSKYTLAEGVDIGKASYEYYRRKSVALGLGFHLSSELTSWPEFNYFLNGILAHKEHYKVDSKNDPALLHFYVHTLIEPAHLEHSEKIISSFCMVEPSAIQEIATGANVYMDFYNGLFKSINNKIYS